MRAWHLWDGRLPTISTEHHRSLAPLLTELKASGFRIVALEQTNRSVPLTTYAFPAKTALISASPSLSPSRFIGVLRRWLQLATRDRA